MSSLLKKFSSKSSSPSVTGSGGGGGGSYVLNPRDSNWITKYVEITTHLGFRDFDRSWFDTIHAEIVRDLFNMDNLIQLDRDIFIHLLALLELMIPMFDSEEKVEKTLAFLNQSIRKNEKKISERFAIIKRQYQCATSMVLYFPEMTQNNPDMVRLFQDFVSLLIRHSVLPKSPVYETCLDCLHEIASCHPELIDATKNQIEKPANVSEAYYLLPLLDHQGDIAAIRDRIQQLSFVPDIKFYHLCTFVEQLVQSGRYQDSLSLLVLRPFLPRFISSNQIHNIQFALKLLKEFGFEIYTSLEEELFLKQMVRACTMSSLPVGFRLLLLSFIRIAFESIFKPPLISPPLHLLNCLHPLQIDGTDTQERKLLILNQSLFVVTDDDFMNAMESLHRMTSAEYHNHERATNAMFHVINQAIKKRPQLMDRILALLLDSFFNSNYIHYIRKFCMFLHVYKELGQKLTDNFIAKLMVSTKDQEPGTNTTTSASFSYRQYSLYLNFINWFLSVAHRSIHLTEFQLEFLINFIYRNSCKHTESSTLALQCCTSILYYQRVTPKVKTALLILLEWLKNERKSDLEASSLAQIYLLALRTLTEESIKQVFTSDEEEFLLYQISPEKYEQYLSNTVKQASQICPVSVQRNRKPDTLVRQKQRFGDELFKTLEFEIFLDATSDFECVFCVEISFVSRQIDHLEQTFQIPVIRSEGKPLRIDLFVDFLIKSAILLEISVTFVDIKGNIYNYYQTKTELVPLEDFLIELVGQDCEKIESELRKHPESMQCTICIRHHDSIKSFLLEHQWLEKFLIDDFHFLIGLPPDRAILGTITITNGFVNVWITTNHYSMMPSLFSRFKNSINDNKNTFNSYPDVSR